jgi:hypothetical protein
MFVVTEEIRPHRLDPREVPEGPPAHVLDEVYAAHDHLEELARAGTTVDLGRDPRTGRVVVTVRGQGSSRRLTGARVFDLLD